MAQNGPAHHELITVESPHLDSSIFIILHSFIRYNLAKIIISDITSHTSRINAYHAKILSHSYYRS